MPHCTHTKHVSKRKCYYEQWLIVMLQHLKSVLALAQCAANRRAAAGLNVIHSFCALSRWQAHISRCMAEKTAGRQWVRTLPHADCGLSIMSCVSCTLTPAASASARPQVQFAHAFFVGAQPAGSARPWSHVAHLWMGAATAYMLHICRQPDIAAAA